MVIRAASRANAAYHTTRAYAVPLEVWPPLANSPSYLAPIDTRLAKRHSAPAVTSARLVGALAPVTVKLPPGIAWNAALTVRSLEWSLAQAARPRSAMIVPSRSANWVWNHEPSSVRVAVTDLPA